MSDGLSSVLANDQANKIAAGGEPGGEPAFSGDAGGIKLPMMPLGMGGKVSIEQAGPVTPSNEFSSAPYRQAYKARIGRKANTPIAETTY